MGIVDEIKQKLDIVDIVQESVPGLKKSGRSFKANCPFHSEKTPSFFVFPEKQNWHCFGSCSTGGDIFSFIMKKEGWDFNQALTFLAERAGITLKQIDLADESSKKRKILTKINEEAASFYNQQLKSSALAERARIFLVEKNITPSTINEFLLGYSPPDKQSIVKYLTSLGYDAEDICKAGLAIKEETNDYYDRFHNRLMIPIKDSAGNIVAFGARTLDDSLPKYLNSPETDLFQKSNTLYALDKAKTAIKDKRSAVIVEGYFDAIVAHQSNFNNVVASMGIALTDKQLILLKRYTNNLILSLDADAAGEMATLRGLETTARAFEQKVVPVPDWRGIIRYENVLDADIKIAILTAGKDPDEIISKGVDLWQDILKKALPVVDYVFSILPTKLNLNNIKERAELVRQIMPVINEIKDPVKQSYFIQKLSRIALVDERLLVERLQKVKKSDKISRYASQERTLSEEADKRRVEEYYLSSLIHFPKLLVHMHLISPDYFEGTMNRALFLNIIQNNKVENLRVLLDDSLKEHFDYITEIKLPPLISDEQAEAVILDCSRKMKENWLKSLKLREETLLSNVKMESNQTEINELQELALKLNKELKDIFHKEISKDSEN